MHEFLWAVSSCYPEYVDINCPKTGKNPTSEELGHKEFTISFFASLHGMSSLSFQPLCFKDSICKYTFQETQRKAQETEAHAQETGRKLQVLMDAVNSCSVESQHSGPRPVPPNATTSASQRTISAQRRLQWHQSSQGKFSYLFVAFLTNRLQYLG